MAVKFDAGKFLELVGARARERTQESQAWGNLRRLPTEDAYELRLTFTGQEMFASGALYHDGEAA